MNRDAPAHAVTAHSHSFFVHMRLRKQKTPALSEDTRELRVGCFGLYLRSRFNMGRGRITEQFENVDGKGTVSELRKLSRLDFNVLAEPAFGVDQKQRRPW